MRRPFEYDGLNGYVTLEDFFAGCTVLLNHLLYAPSSRLTDNVSKTSRVRIISSAVCARQRRSGNLHADLTLGAISNAA